MSYNYDILLKYIVIGDSSTGKSSLIHRFVNNVYTQHNQPTLAAQFSHKIIHVKEIDIKIMIWDTAGQQTFKSMVRSFYKNCIVAFVVYDATKKQTFANIENWLSQINEHCHQFKRIVLISNKSDLIKNIQIPRSVGQSFAKEKGYDFYQVSAATGTNVQEMFVQPALKLINDLQTKNLILPPQMDIGVRFSNRKQFQANKKLVEINIKGTQGGNCKC